MSELGCQSSLASCIRCHIESTGDSADGLSGSSPWLGSVMSRLWDSPGWSLGAQDRPAGWSCRLLQGRKKTSSRSRPIGHSARGTGTNCSTTRWRLSWTRRAPQCHRCIPRTGPTDDCFPPRSSSARPSRSRQSVDCYRLRREQCWTPQRRCNWWLGSGCGCRCRSVSPSRACSMRSTVRWSLRRNRRRTPELLPRREQPHMPPLMWLAR